MGELLVVGGRLLSERYSLGSREFRIGRSRDSDMRIEESGVAWNHWSGVRQITQVAGGGLTTSSNVSGVNTGFVLGAGIELKLPLVRLLPEVRYTRWGAKNITDLGGALQSNQNQAEFLLAWTF